LGYSECSEKYKVYNFETNTMEESIHIKFDDKNPDNRISELVDSFADIEIYAEP